MLGAKKQKTSLVISVGNASVGAACVSFAKDKKPEIIATSRRSVVMQKDKINFKRFLSSTLQALGDVVEDIKIIAKQRPDDIHCVLSSPWYVAQTRVINYESNKEFSVTKNLVASLLKKESEKFEVERKQKNSIILGSQNEIIETKNMKTVLNGYETTKPLGKKTKKLSVHLFLSISSEKILKSFSQILLRAYHHKKVLFHTLPFVSFDVLRDIIPGNNDSIFCDIGGEISDVLVVYKNNIVEVASFPLGHNFIARALSKEFKTVPAEAFSLIRAENEGHLSSGASQKINMVLDHASTEWFKSFKEVLDTSSLECLLPGKCFLLTNKDMVPVFVDAISRQDTAEFTMSNKPFVVIPVNHQLLKKFCNTRPGVKKDLFLAISTIFINENFKI